MLEWFIDQHASSSQEIEPGQIKSRPNSNCRWSTPSLAVEVGIQYVGKICDGCVSLVEKILINVESCKVILCIGSGKSDQYYCDNFHALFHWYLIMEHYLLIRINIIYSTISIFENKITILSNHPTTNDSFYYFALTCERQLANGRQFDIEISWYINYYKLQLIEMTTWLGDKYEGQYKEGWYHGFGKLHLDNGIVYQGQFVKGQFHGEGKLIYPNGGYYKAQWLQGKMLNGEYIFNDNLNFEKEGWKHCINDDRRFYQEYLHGIKPSGATQKTRQDKPHTIPTGTYDTGDGYYEPVKSIIYSYDGKIYRTPTQQEVKFIIEKCRYVPKAVDIDGNKDRVIKKVLQIQTKK